MFYPPIRHVTGQDLGAAASASGAQEKARRAQEEVELLRQDIERLLMITESMWTILKEEFEYGDEELVRRVAEIDKRDGREDGRVAPGPPPLCPNCNRILERQRSVCIYCGQRVLRSPFER